MQVCVHVLGGGHIAEVQTPGSQGPHQRQKTRGGKRSPRVQAPKQTAVRQSKVKINHIRNNNPEESA